MAHHILNFSPFHSSTRLLFSTSPIVLISASLRCYVSLCAFPLILFHSATPSLFFTSPFLFFLPSCLQPSPRRCTRTNPLVLPHLIPCCRSRLTTPPLNMLLHEWEEAVVEGKWSEGELWIVWSGRKQRGGNGEKVEQQCRPRRGRTKTGENSRNKEVEMRKRQRTHGRRGNSRRKTGSNLIPASFHSSPLFLLIVSQFPASVSFSITYRIFYFSGFPFLCISLRFSLSSPFAGSLSFFFFFHLSSKPPQL